MMRTIITTFILLLASSSLLAQTNLEKAREFYNKGEYANALPLFEAEYNLKKNNASISHWYGVSLFETNGDMQIAEEALLFGSSRRVRDSLLYLGRIYTKQYRFSEAKEMFDSYEKHLKRRGDEEPKEYLETLRKELSRRTRIVSATEDIQIIDSLVITKANFLDAYKMSLSTGKLDYYNSVFTKGDFVNSVVYTNEKESKMYYAHPDEELGTYTLFSNEKLLDDFGSEKKLSPNNFGLEGKLNYPFLMADGVTIYFAAEDQNTLGGFDLFVTRYNMNTDSYLRPERLNAPFNSPYNDYMMVIDEEKGVGWFASDRFQAKDMVCVYTFIPNDVVKTLESEDESYLASRALISSIKNTWIKDTDYTVAISRARAEVKAVTKKNYDFTFVIDDERTYHYYDDFQNRSAENTFRTAQSTKKHLNEAIALLSKKRDEYENGTTAVKSSLKEQILKLEGQVNSLRIDVNNLEVSARNREIEKQ